MMNGEPVKEKKILSKEQVEVILHKVDSEGIAYAVQEGYLDELEETIYGEDLAGFKESMSVLENGLDELAEEHGIESED